MRFSTVVISSTLALAGMNAALSIERENMLAARFADSDYLAEVEARAYDEPELYARGGAMSKMVGKKKDNPPSYRSAARDPPPRYQASPNHIPHLDSFQRETDYSNNHKSPAYTSGSSSGRRHRRSYYADDGLMARGNAMSRGSGQGDKERKDGRPPKYKVAASDPPPRYEPSEHHPPPLPSFRTETDYSRNRKTPSATSRHRRSFYDLD